MDISSQIKSRRAALGLSQEELAERIYVSRQTISNWETEKTYPDVQSLLLLSVLFDTTIDELVKGDIEMMEKTIASADAKKFKRGAYVMAAGLVLMIPFAIGGAYVVGNILGAGFAIIPWVVAMIAATEIERMKKDLDLMTYREISAFINNRPVDRTARSKWSLLSGAYLELPGYQRGLIVAGAAIIGAAVAFVVSHGVMSVIAAFGG